jgi:predicted RNA-binding protein with RPS1 domain
MNVSEYQVNEIIVGKVSEIVPYGAFVIFPNGQKGLVHISEISEDYVRRISDYVIVGEIIRVKVLSIDPNNQYLKLSMKRINKEISTDEKHPFWIKVPRHEIDFEPLRKKLPEWIEDTLKKGE